MKTLKLNTMNRYELIDKVVAEIAKDKGISEGEVGTYDTLLRVADIAVKNCSIPNVVGRSEQLPQNFCTLNQQTCGKGSGCKYPHCHL